MSADGARLGAQAAAGLALFYIVVVAGSSTLEVDGVRWPADGWSGDGPGGHHRDGELRFAPAGPAAGTVRLTLSGFGAPVEASWELGG